MNDTAPDPAEPTLSLSRDLTIGGQPSLGFDTYTVRQLADLIEPALQQQRQGGTADAARRAAHAIVCRHNRCAGEQSAPAPRNALSAPQTAEPPASGCGGHPGDGTGPKAGTQGRAAGAPPPADAEQADLRAERDMLGRETDRLRRGWTTMRDRAEKHRRDAEARAARIIRTETALARVRALHHNWDADPGHCAHCQDGMGTPLPWPCPTIRALDAPQAGDDTTGGAP